MQQSWTGSGYIADSPFDQAESYLTDLTSFLSTHPPGSIGSVLSSSKQASGTLPSPDTSNGSSPTSDLNVSSDNHATASKVPGVDTTLSRANLAAMTASVNVNNDKRKDMSNTNEGAMKDSRRSSSNGSQSGDGGIHTHPDFDDDIDGKDENGGKGKTSDKRRQQNRQAQRAFRERKERHLKELEDRVFSLEQQSSEQSDENSALKQLLERLQTENERLKMFESAFSFSYAKDVSNSSSMSTAAQFKPPTPPTAQDELDDLSKYGISQPFTLDNSSSVNNEIGMPSLFSPPSSYAGTNGTGNISFLNSSQSLSAAASPGSHSAAGESTGSSSANVTTPSDNVDIFSLYRDTTSAPGLSSLTDLDNIFGDSTAEESAAFAAYIASPSPPVLSPPVVSRPAQSAAQPLGSPALHADVTPPCSGANDASSQSDGKFSFDLDGLCSEMKTKATCREAARNALKEAMKEDEKSVQNLYPDP